MNKYRARIVSNVDIDQNTGCWNWRGAARENGYCRTSFGRKNWYIHRMSYSAFIGEIPDGHDVCHKCDNRRCCNPYHLFVGTRKDNMQDALRKGRIANGEKLSVHHRGEKSFFSKLKESDVIEIRLMLSNGCKTKAIAKKFNVSTDNIRRIKRKDTWRHI